MDWDFNFEDILNEFSEDTKKQPVMSEKMEQNTEAIERTPTSAHVRSSKEQTLLDSQSPRKSSIDDEKVKSERKPTSRRMDQQKVSTDEQVIKKTGSSKQQMRKKIIEHDDERSDRMRKKAPHDYTQEAIPARRRKVSSGIEKPAMNDSRVLRKKERKRHGKVAAIVFLLLIAAIVIVTVYAGIQVTNSSVIFPNVMADTINIGKMTPDTALSVLNQNGWQEKVNTKLSITSYGDVKIEVDPLRAGTVTDAESLVEKAFRFGHDGNIFKNLLTYLNCLMKPVNINEDGARIDTSYISSQAEQCAQQLTELLGTEAYHIDKEHAELSTIKGQGSMRLDTNALKQQILSALENGQTELRFTALSSEPLMPDFQSVFQELSVEPRDAKFTDDGKFNIIEETVGCWFDVEQAKSLWNQAAPAEKVTIPLQITYPDVTAAKLNARLYGDLLGVMTTDYSASVENRKNNVRLATSKIDGTILYPGDDFSYNTVVGARTVEAGFLSAPAYSNGEVVEEIGGGACQVSSTLYSACLFANMTITDRTNHYFRVNYMQLGTDATVTIPAEGNAVDYCFRNDRTYPVKIVGICEEDEEGYCKLTFEIWGTREDGEYAFVDFNNSNQYGWENRWSREVEIDDPGSSIPAKVKLVTDMYAANDDAIGRSCTRTLTYRIVTDLEGNELEKLCVNAVLPNGLYAMDTYYNH